MTKQEIAKHLSVLLNLSVTPSQIITINDNLVSTICDKNYMDDILSKLSKSNILLINKFYRLFGNFYQIELYKNDLKNIDI